MRSTIKGVVFEIPAITDWEVNHEKEELYVSAEGYYDVCPTFDPQDDYTAFGSGTRTIDISDFDEDYPWNLETVKGLVSNDDEWELDEQGPY